MISYLRGKIVLAKWGLLIIDVSGVGYKVSVNPQISLSQDMIAGNTEVELFTYQHIKEDSSDLYGFLKYEELELFEKLISVNGVGPKAAINIMSSAQPDRIIQAIVSDDLGFFVAISGIGKKVAAKIILELKSKISSDKSINIIGQMEDSDDLISALEALGYKRVELQAILTRIPAEIIDTEEKVRWCLKKLAKF